jgi:hypothetical protein
VSSGREPFVQNVKHNNSLNQNRTRVILRDSHKSAAPLFSSSMRPNEPTNRVSPVSTRIGEKDSSSRHLTQKSNTQGFLSLSSLSSLSRLVSSLVSLSLVSLPYLRTGCVARCVQNSHHHVTDAELLIVFGGVHALGRHVRLRHHLLHILLVDVTVWERKSCELTKLSFTYALWPAPTAVISSCLAVRRKNYKQNQTLTPGKERAAAYMAGGTPSRASMLSGRSPPTWS